MLLEFSLKNFKCFKDEATLSFIPGATSALNTHIIESKNPKHNALRSAVIYGANGAGKSSLMDGARFMCTMVLNSPGYTKEYKLTTPCFQFDNNCMNKPISFKINFTHKKERYEYSFSYNKNQFLTENLFHYSETGRRRKLFNREKQDFSFGSTFKKGKGFKKVLESLQENQLLASAPSNSLSLNIVYDFFKSCSFIYNPEKLVNFTNKFIYNNVGNKNFNILLNKIMSKIDIGIESVHVLKITVEDVEDKLQTLPDDLREELIKKYRDQDIFEIFFKHNGSENLVPFKLESKGTQKLYSLLGPILNGYLRESILFIDEFNSSLHPILVEFLIDFLHNQEQYTGMKNTNQFVINLHDTSLLNPSIFRRDQIWFIAKDEKGASELYSLDDFKDRSNLIQRNYLDGRYGATPIIKRFS